MKRVSCVHAALVEEETSTSPSSLWRAWLCNLNILENGKGVLFFVSPRELFLKWRFQHVKVFNGMTSTINRNRMYNILKQTF